MSRAIYFVLLVFGGLFVLSSCRDVILEKDLAVEFSGKYGQVEVGGKYAGLEFHHSRPLPCRISFYYPVANSIDLSNDYWKRDESRPLTLIVKVNGQIDSLDQQSMSYRYTPYTVTFEKSNSLYRVKISYHFCNDLPVVVWSVSLENISREILDYQVFTALQMILRSCHTYARIEQTREEYQHSASDYLTFFDDRQVDSAAVFVLNAGEKPLDISEQGVKSAAAFEYQKSLKPKEKINLIQLIGTCRQSEVAAITEKVKTSWEKEITLYEKNCGDYSGNQQVISTGDAGIDHTARWAKAVMAANQHYLDGRIVPMPCPAEYNFFFTHDALLTDLGAINFDPTRVKKDLLYLLALTRPDSILPHAYYWKDDGFKTEYCGNDNWNHFWFIILANSYFLHSGDTATVLQLLPVLEKSVQMTLRNKRADDLMYATRPDWWDIGNLTGARAYVTILMIKALQDFAALKSQITPGVEVSNYLDIAHKMSLQLEKILWSDQVGYLLNMLDTGNIDQHFYAGSLVAAAFRTISDQKSRQLITTAEKELLDPQLGIRNAMPADFHELGKLYHFQGLEMGGPYLYINGGVWPQGNIWYGLALLRHDQADRSLMVLKKYLTLEGISNSPNGQPSFYEYRNANPHSQNYGQIDKPTFLWSGGLYLYYLYQLMGIQENPYHLAVHPGIPDEFESLRYPLYISGKSCQLTWQGKGRFFEEIRWNGKTVNSAILYKPAAEITLSRGLPRLPYLAEFNGQLEEVKYYQVNKTLNIVFSTSGIQSLDFLIVSPFEMRKVLMDQKEFSEKIDVYREEGIYKYRVYSKLAPQVNQIVCQF